MAHRGDGEPAIETGRYAELAGWYDDGDRTILLTHIPEADLGEPMILVRDGDRVFRAYPKSADRLEVDDGSTLNLATLRRSADFRERDVTFQAAGTTLAGTLVTPTGTGRHPGVVLVHGAAGGQRDFCRLFAQDFLEAGVATLIYDKRGHGRSGGSAGPTIFDQAAAASAAVDLLKTESDLDPDRIGLSGFSNGMWAVPMVAASRSDIAFVAGIGSPGVTMADSEIHRRVKVLREAGFSAHARHHVDAAWRAIFAVASTGTATDAQKAALDASLAALAADEQVAAYQPAAYVKQNPMLSPLPPLMPVDDLVRMVGGSPDPELSYDPADDYRAIDCPVLLQFGECDTSVPAALSAQRLTEALASSGRLTTHVYPGLEHMLNVAGAIDGLSVEETMYGFRRFVFGEGVWADLRRWLVSVAIAH